MVIGRYLRYRAYITRINPGLYFESGKTLLFFDEMQSYPDISTFLKFFAADGRFDVICSGSLLGINYKQIVAAYREDIRKYSEGADQTRITRVFDSIPVQLAKDNKKFQISKIRSDARFHDYGECIDWLQEAGIIKKSYCLSFPELPLKGNHDDTKFKLYMADSGLLSSMLDDESQEDLRANKNLGVYKGAIYESIVGEALYKQGYGLYYYKREDGTLEEDFFIRDKDNLIPIEVKAREGRSQSLKTLIRNDEYADIKWGIKLSMNNIGIENNINTFPYFCSFLLKEWLDERSRRRKKDFT